MSITSSQAAFPKLDADEMVLVRSHARVEDFADGQTVIKAGDPDIDFFVVETGAITILNPIDGNRVIVTHQEREFVGDIDLLTRRSVVICAVAKGATRVLRVPGTKLRELLNTVPRLSEKLLTAFMQRREKLHESNTVVLRVTGPGSCRDTNAVREFLLKNFVPFVWWDSDEAERKAQLARLGNSRWNRPRLKSICDQYWKKPEAGLNFTDEVKGERAGIHRLWRMGNGG